MAVPYEKFTDIEVADDELSSASEDHEEPIEGHLRIQSQSDTHFSDLSPDYQREVENVPRLQHVHEILQNKWPLKVGIVHIVWGVILLIFGLCEVLVLPLIEDTSTEAYMMSHLGKQSCYGVACWSALLLLTSGTLGLRAAIYRSTCNLYSFVTVIMLEMPAFVLMLLLLLIGYTKHWTTRGAYEPGSVLFEVHIAVSVSTALGFVLVVLAFLQYYEEVFCGEMQLCKKCVHCFLPCCCPRAVMQSELLEEDSGRPPSLPV